MIASGVMNSAHPLPRTEQIDAHRALETLDYAEMVALSELFDSWALGEPDIDEQRRARLLAWSVDYAVLAEYCGPEWRASRRDDPPDLIAFIARQALRSNGADEADHERG